MPKGMVIRIGSIRLEAELNDTRVARALWEALPVTGRCNTWGEEIYFSIPVEEDNEDGQEVVNAGDLGYWPPGRAFCIFFGPTPASKGDEIRPASPVTVLGRVLADLAPLRSVPSGAQAVIEARPG